MVWLTINHSRNRKRGFTLIELLVVISIISLLSSIIMTNLTTTRSKARDARRITEFRQIKTALELYYSKYDRYPAGSGTECGGWDGDGSLGNGQFIGALQTEGLMPAVGDPSGGNCKYQYIQRNSGTGYQLLITTENNIPNHPVCFGESASNYCSDVNYP